MVGRYRLIVGHRSSSTVDLQPDVKQPSKTIAGRRLPPPGQGGRVCLLSSASDVVCKEKGK